MVLARGPKRGQSERGTQFEILDSLRWWHYVPVVNILYDVFFDVSPTVEQLRELLNILLMTDMLLLSCVIGLVFSYSYEDYAEHIERFASADGTVGGVSERGYSRLMGRSAYDSANNDPWHFLERFGQYYVITFTSLCSAVLIFVMQYLSLNGTSFHAADGTMSARQLEAYWRYAVFPCFLGTALSIIGAVYTPMTVYFLFVVVFPCKYVAANGKWGDGYWMHNPWKWSHVMFSQVLLALVLSSYVLIGVATTAKSRVQIREHSRGADRELRAIADVGALLRAADLDADDLRALGSPLLANELLKDAGVSSAGARLRILRPPSGARV